ncbi:MAG: porin [Rhizobiaceae bacterium]
MNIRYHLLSSAAVLATVSGAQAADAVVVEPEPVEYVRVCDAYGSGFFYIPGTETCIRFSGFVRSAYEKIEFDGNGTTRAVVDDPDTVPDETAPAAPARLDDVSQTLWGQRGRLNIDTRNETDWGTLRAIYRLEGGQNNVDADIDMDVALISLAGFRAGFAGANYWSSNHGFGGVNAEALSTNASGIIYDDGFYGFDDATIFDYTWASDGFSVTFGAEDPRISFGRGGFRNTTNNGTSGDSRANFYAGFNYSGDGWGVAFTAVHDSIAPEVNSAGTITDTGGWAYKVSANLDLSQWVPGGTLTGYYMDDGEYDTDYVHSNLLTENPETIWGVAFQMNLTDEVEFWVNYWDISGQDGSLIADVATDETGDIEHFGVGLNWFPAAAPGFHIKSSYYIGDVEDATTPAIGAASGGLDRANFDYDGFEVTLRRDF